MSILRAIAAKGYITSASGRSRSDRLVRVSGAGSLARRPGQAVRLGRSVRSGVPGPGQQPQPRRPRVPAVDHDRPGDDVVQGAALVAQEYAQEAQAEDQEAQRERQRAADRSAPAHVGGLPRRQPHIRDVSCFVPGII